MNPKISFKFLIAVSISCASFAQTKVYDIDVNVPPIKIYSDHLKLGGSNAKGDKISVNNHYITVNNKPFIPITGEFHFSRYPAKYWDESIKKMKAGGINVIATYVFWNIHEEIEGKFTWTGDYDVKKFVELCKKNNIYCIVRIGPFCHGEIRNGGLPDWLLGRPLTIRSNDPKYLAYVDRLYKETAKQLTGLYYKNDGPIIGIQIENEYQHSAAPWGLTYPEQPHDFTASERDLSVTQEGVGVAQANNPYATMGNDHMKVLKTLAVKAGMEVPLYTATGWGNAAIITNESIPVMAAYAYPFWTPKRDLSPFFLFKDMHKDPDYAPVRYKAEDYPVFPAELGSGIMSVYTRRPIAIHKSMDAMINRCVGSGANGVGYYMYHGGSTPKGVNSYFSDEAYGLPKISYDFQAPIGEYGQVREGFHRLKLLHFFMQNFGDVLAPMQTVLPTNASTLKPENINDLRYAARVQGNAGFVFINNFQDDTALTEKTNIQIKVKTATGDIMFPEEGGLTLKSEENVIFPFNFNMNGANLIHATAQLMVKGDDPSKPYYVFFTPEGIQGEFLFSTGVSVEGNDLIQVTKKSNNTLVKCNVNVVSEFIVSTTNGTKIKVLVLPKSMALKSYVVWMNGKKHLMFSDAVVLQNGNAFTLLSDGKNKYSVQIYPNVSIVPKIDQGSITASSRDNMFVTYDVSLPEATIKVQSQSIGQKKYVINMPQWNNALNDIFLTVDYTGDTGMGFLNGELVTDEFYKGIPWQIGLRKFYPTTTKEMVFYFRPMYKDASYLIDLQPYPAAIPNFGNQKTFLKINSTYFTPQYKSVIKF